MVIILSMSVHLPLQIVISNPSWTQVIQCFLFLFTFPTFLPLHKVKLLHNIIICNFKFCKMGPKLLFGPIFGTQGPGADLVGPTHIDSCPPPGISYTFDF